MTESSAKDVKRSQDSLLSIRDTYSDTRLVTSYDYSTQGWLNNITDPRGLVTLSEFDAAGRTTTTYENYVNGTPSGDDDRKTVYTHDGMDHVLTLKAYLDSTSYQEPGNASRAVVRSRMAGEK